MNKNDRVLAERAAKLADPIKDESKLEKIEYISFFLGGDSEYGIIYKDVEGVVRSDQICKVPMAPQSITGVINWRGNLLTVVNLNFFLSKNEASLGENPWVIIVRAAGSLIGLAANEVGTNRFYLMNELVTKRQSAVKSIRYIKGVVSKKVAIIDTMALLKDVRL